jgi:hypothetical protein
LGLVKPSKAEAADIIADLQATIVDLQTANAEQAAM